MKLFSVIKQHARRGLLTVTMVFGAASGALSTAILLVINEYLFAWGDRTRERTILIFAALLVLVAVSRFLSAYTLISLGARTACDLQIRLSERIIGAPLRRLEEIGSHRLLVALTDDIRAVTDAMAQVPVLVINAAVVVGCIVYLGWLSWQVLAVVLVFMAVGIISYVLPMQAAMRRQELAREVDDDLFGHFRGLTQGTKELKMRRRRGQDFIAALQETAGSFRDYIISSLRIFLAASSWGNLLFFIVIGIVLFYLPLYMNGIDLRIMASYVMVLIYMLTPLQMVLNDLPFLTQADVAVRKIEQLGISLAKDAEPETANEEKVEPGWAKLELCGVSHTYSHESDDAEFTLGPVDLTFRPGEWVFVVGGNGSGKTTFAKLLLGLYPPEAGELFLDGKLVEDQNRGLYRQLFSVVFTDFFLFESLLGLSSPDLDSKAREYLEKLHLNHKVRVQSGELSTIELSQGQRKRLALLTAYLEDSPIFLFDEWAADQDPEFKEVFYRQLVPALKARGKLVIVISHDDRYYHLGDRIIRFEYGNLIYDKPIAQTEYGAVKDAV